MNNSYLDISRRRDRWAERLIKAGGLLVICAVVGILALIAKVAVPLFIPPSAEKLATVPAELQALAVTKPQQAGRFQRDLGENGQVTALLTPSGGLQIVRRMVTKDLLGTEQQSTALFTLSGPLPGALTALWIDKKGERLFAGTANGWLLRWDIAAAETARLLEQLQAFSDGRPITALATLLGEHSLAVGDGQGQVTVWQAVTTPGRGEEKQLTLVHRLPGHAGAVQGIVPSPRDKSLASWDASGTVKLSHMTSERLLVSLSAGENLQSLTYSVKGTELLAIGKDDVAQAWRLDIPHPEVSLGTLFGAVQYEGYDSPAHVWQSSAANDDFEPKLSLRPLIFGTIKATLFAMLFAVPLALFGALYTSQFMSPGLKGRIKPAVEIMAAVPSVVVGFLAGLWLAPLLDKTALAAFISLLLVPAMIGLAILVWRKLYEHPLGRRIKGYEFLGLLPVIVCAVWISFEVSGPLEAQLFGGDFKQWLYATLGVRYDQRNSIVIAIALGFAVIPLIFTIAEDALSNVPRNLSAASMALGASRWQTAWRVVLPSALPGVFSAIMIGFGRAVGETMIVLMATGNTPIESWSLFNGLRSLSANIAVEIPEAPLGGTLYRVLFLSAVLLFMFTFIINTAAELLRQRFRKKYGRY